MEFEDDVTFPQMPEMSWTHWHAACVFCMAGVEDALVGDALRPWTQEQWQAANHFYASIHTEARHPTVLPGSDEGHEWQRNFFVDLMERETSFDIAPFDPRPFISQAREEGGAFDFDDAVQRVRDAIYAMPHIGPFREAPWTARQIGASVSRYSQWLFHDGNTVRLYGKPLADRSGTPIDGIDPTAFRMIGEFFAIDQRQGYAFVKHQQFPSIDHIVALPSVDPQNFIALNDAFAADGAAVYHRSGKRLTKDADRFKILPDPAGRLPRSEKAQDGRQTFAGDKVLEGLSWEPPPNAVPCPVAAIEIDDHIILPPAYRLFASIEREADGRVPAGLTALLRDLHGHFGTLLRTGRIMVKAGKFPRVKLTSAHWEKLEAAARESLPYETFHAEFYDRLDHHGLAAETPAGKLNAGVTEITLDLALPPQFDWEQVDTVLWRHIEEMPVLYAVQGYGLATEMGSWVNRDPALHAMAVRGQAVCGLGLSGEDMGRFTVRPENRGFATSFSEDERPIPDLGFKTLVTRGVLDENAAMQLAAIPLAHVSKVASGAMLIQLGETPIWGVKGDDTALVSAYRQARATLSAHRLTP